MTFFSRLLFPPYAPDLSDQETQTSQNILNVLPQADGYGPFYEWDAFSQSLPSNDNIVRGTFFARNEDGTLSIFCATATNLYLLNNTTFAWSNVSLGGGPYTALSSTGQWMFEQFGNTVIAVQGNVVPQVFTLQVSTAFSNLGGSPPQAAYIAIVNRFVLLSGLTSSPYRIQWSDLDAPTTWTPGTGQADFQDLPDGGLTRTVLGFDLYGVIFQDNMARLLTYTAGSPVIFTITKITGGDGNGLFAPYAAVIDQDNVFWLSQEGVKMMAPGGAPTPIGKEIVDRYIFANIDSSNLQLCMFTTDPTASRVYLAFKSLAGTMNNFDTVMVYDWELQRWSRVMVTAQWIDVMQRPGATEETLDSMTAGATTVTGIFSGASNGSGGAYIRLGVSSTSGMSTAAQQTGPWPNSVDSYPSGYGPGTWNVTQVVGSSAAVDAIQYLPEVPSGVEGSPPGSSWYGVWQVNVVDGTHIDLIADIHSNPSAWHSTMTWSSGGVVGGNVELSIGSFDNISLATTPKLCAFVNGVLGFFTGPTLEATLETAEQGTNEQRMQINGLRLITNASGALGAISYRETPQASYSYTTPVGMNVLGVAPIRMETRYARAQMTIPAGQTWTYAQGVEPDGKLTGNR
jgi:hypothetical protein